MSIKKGIHKMTIANQTSSLHHTRRSFSSIIRYLPCCIPLLVCLLSPVALAQVVINEIHSNPDKKTEHVEFVELHNPTDYTLDLSGWCLKNAVDFTFPQSTLLAPGGYLVIGEDVDEINTKFGTESNALYGPIEGKLGNDGDTVVLCNAAGDVMDKVDYALGFPWPMVGDSVPDYRAGKGHSIQLVNPLFDNDLAGSWRSAYPTPGTINSVYAANLPPHIRQVKHSPKQPVPGEAVTVTAKVTDPDGVAGVIFRYQFVDPGEYIHIDDDRYQTDWTDLPMADNGVGSDEIAGDSIFALELPSAMQTHRRLVRYRITISDILGNTQTVPYEDDPQPNFAYFVYGGVPPWTGADRPDRTPEVTYSSEMLSSLPVYHLITSQSETEDCTWFDHQSSNNFSYTGTLVYGGHVYDHVTFRARGGVWRYAMGKNMWKFNFNRGHYFQAYDNYGQPYKEKWNILNLGANIQQRDYMHRGEQGLFESVGFKLFNLTGVESAYTHFVHFRIIDEEHEDGKQNASHSGLTISGTQYDGDFWGLYLATEQMDGHFLDEHGLPDGNMYKMEHGSGDLKNQAPDGATNKSDLNDFIRNYQKRPNSQWWRENTDVDRYYSYRSIVEAIHQYDVGAGKNYYYFLNPDTNRWSQHPWDLDLSWADNMYGNGNEPFKQFGLLNLPDLKIEYQNRQREILDLLYNPDQTGQLIDEMASLIYNPNGESFVDADRAMWDYHWVMNNKASRYKTSGNKSGQGEFYKIAPTKDFPGMIQLMKDYVISRGEWISRRFTNDDNIPETPIVTVLSDQFSIDSLSFQSSAFSDPQGNQTFSTIQWRIGEVNPDAKPWQHSSGGNEDVYISDASTWKYFRGTEEPSNPMSAWRQPEFDDSTWQNGQAPIGYGENFMNTTLNDMRYNYTTIYLRKTFTVDDPASTGPFALQVLFDDGFNAWINGVHVAMAHVNSENMPYDSLAVHREDLKYTDFPLGDISSILVPGENTIAVQIINQYIDRSSDCFIDVRLVADPDGQSAEETPGGFQYNRSKPGQYEITALWETELDTFQDRITVPANAVTIGHTYRVRARMMDDTGRASHWSPPVQFTVTESDNSAALLENLRITEVMYNPSDNLEFEYIELFNAHPSLTLFLGGIAITNGVDYVFPENTEIPPGEYALVTACASASDRAAFRAIYNLDPAVPIFGPYSGKLSNGGERVTLKRSDEGTEIVSFEYSDGRGWPVSTDGAGHSLVPIDSAAAMQHAGSLEYGGNWRASAFIAGSPGRIDPDPIVSIVLNEFLANGSATGAGGSSDWIELYNRSSQPIGLGAWFLSDDDSNLKKWAIPSVDIQSSSLVSFDEDTGFNQPGANGFGVSRNGESLFLSYLPGVPGVDRVADAVSFKAQEENVSLGRFADGEPFFDPMPPSRNGSNQPGMRLVAIDEFMYHPSVNMDENDSNAEFIELYNPGTVPVKLWTENGPWRLDGGIDFVFPTGTAIPAMDRLLIVGFDPADSVSRQAFLETYSLDTGNEKIVGPFTGKLSNRGERIALEKPLDLDDLGQPDSWSIVDEVIYFHRTPWSPKADGLGLSLQRKSVTGSGNDPANWTATVPTPAAEWLNTPVKQWSLY